MGSISPFSKALQFHKEKILKYINTCKFNPSCFAMKQALQLLLPLKDQGSLPFWTAFFHLPLTLSMARSLRIFHHTLRGSWRGRAVLPVPTNFGHSSDTFPCDTVTFLKAYQLFVTRNYTKSHDVSPLPASGGLTQNCLSAASLSTSCHTQPDSFRLSPANSSTQLCPEHSQDPFVNVSLPKGRYSRSLPTYKC